MAESAAAAPQSAPWSSSGPGPQSAPWSSSALGLAQLAARHGLRVAGARPGLVAYSRQVWHYRHFVAAFANAKLVAAFTTARLGRLWQVLTPLVNAAVYYLIFGVVLNTRSDVANFIGYLCAGIFLFGYTQQVTLAGLGSILDNLGLIRALQFPRASLPIAATLIQSQQLLPSTAVLLVIFVVTGEPVTIRWLLAVPVLVLLSLFNVGLALMMARLGAKIADLKQLMPFVLRTWMYASGVFYSVSRITEHLPAFAATIFRLNPLLVYIDLVRHALLESPPAPPWPLLHTWLIAIGWALLVSVTGYIYFWRGEQEYGRG